VAQLRLQVSHVHSRLDELAAPRLNGHPSPSAPWSHPVQLHLHALCVEDITIQSVLRESPPLFTSVWQNLGGPADAAALQRYAEAVYASTNAYLDGLPADGLQRSVDLRKFGLGRRSVGSVVRRFVVQELEHICREIAGRVGSSRPLDGAVTPAVRSQLVR
jgi:hypothetical protein